MTQDALHREIRVRVIIVREGRMLLVSPRDEAYRGLPGGGLEPNESLYEAGEREVYEEIGLRVRVKSVAFLREWVAPRHCRREEMERILHGRTDSAQALLPEQAYCLEVYLWAELAEGEPTEPRPEAVLAGAFVGWIPLEELEQTPLFCPELRALARDVLAGGDQAGIPIITVGREGQLELPGPT